MSERPMIRSKLPAMPALRSSGRDILIFRTNISNSGMRMAQELSVNGGKLVAATIRKTKQALNAKKAGAPKGTPASLCSLTSEILAQKPQELDRKHGADGRIISGICGPPNYLKTPNAKIKITSKTTPSASE